MCQYIDNIPKIILKKLSWHQCLISAYRIQKHLQCTEGSGTTEDRILAVTSLIKNYLEQTESCFLLQNLERAKWHVLYLFNIIHYSLTCRAQKHFISSIQQQVNYKQILLGMQDLRGFKTWFSRTQKRKTAPKGLWFIT